MSLSTLSWMIEGIQINPILAMRILHFSDLHVWNLRIVRDDLWYPKRWLGTVNLLARRRFKFPIELAHKVLDEIHRQESDLIVFSGDISTQSIQEEFLHGSRLFEPLVHKWGDRFFVIPGNHDRYTPRSVQRGYYENNFPYGSFGPDGKRVRVLRLKNKLAVVGFDCSIPYCMRSNGSFSKDLAEELDDILEEQARVGHVVILVGHFPYALPEGVKDAWDHKLIGARLLATIVRRHQPILYLHGHKHQRWCFVSPDTKKTVCINAGSAGMQSSNPSRRAGYVSIELGENLRLERVHAHVASCTRTELFQRLPLFANGGILPSP